MTKVALTKVSNNLAVYVRAQESKKTLNPKSVEERRGNDRSRNK